MPYAHIRCEGGALKLFLRILICLTILRAMFGVDPVVKSQTTGPNISFLPIINAGEPVNSSEWGMVAGNPARTSWAKAGVSGNVRVEWYRPIDAYIPPNFQVIAANNMVYIASARGLYAMRYDTGEVIWRYDTELPLGNSPTIASINGTSIAFVGGYDKKIHAINALTGSKIWEFNGAKAGFDANPLVMNNTVYVGNRDGHFYAIDAANGSLVWQFPAANQDGIGAIHLSPAYKNNTIYFATDYNFGYALDTNGTLKWKSQKLVGDGYNSYWPVVYSNPSTNKDYVIFSGKMPYREFMRPGTRSYNNSETYNVYGAGLADTSHPANLGDGWASGKTILDYTPTMQYFEQKPYQRIYTILDGSTGNEFTMDLDHDGKPEYFPVWPVYNPNTQHPPIIGPDNLIYINNDTQSNRNHVMGWKFGTPYFALSALNDANDEPMIISGGGNNLFRALCCSRTANYTSLPNLSEVNTLWPYGGNSLGYIAPGYDEKLFYLNPSFLDNLTALYGNVNGIYGYHGEQNPIIPYKNKLFTHKGNAIIAFGSGVARGKLPLLKAAASNQDVPLASDAELRQRLEKEIQKIVTAGILKPGYTDDSQFGSRYYQLDNYFENPGDGLYTLSIAYPYLSVELQSQLKNYLKGTYYPRYFDPTLHFRIGWRDGVQRDSIAMPPEILADFQQMPDDYDWFVDETLTWYYHLYIHTNPNNFYAMWKYAAKVAPEDRLKIYQRAKQILTTGRCQYTDCTHVPPPASDSRLIKNPYELNAYISGYLGFLKLQEFAGQQNQDYQLRNSVTNELNRLKALRISQFSKNTPYTTYENGYGLNFLNISRNFIFLTPELAADLRQSKLAQVQAAVQEYETIGSYWFVSRFNAAAAESGFQNLYDSPSLMAAKAWILNEPREKLYKYLDVPAFERGDLFYIQNLVTVIEAPVSP